MEDEKIKNLQTQYQDAIVCLQDKQEIINALPQPDYTSFYPIIEALITRITTEIEETQRMYNEETDSELKEYIKEELSLLQFKLNSCLARKQEAKKIEQNEIIANTQIQKNIIFATNNRSTYLEQDLKNIPEEYYQTLLETIESLQNGANGKPLINNNKLSKIYEMNLFKLRVVYRILSGDTVFIIMAKMKKSQNDTDDFQKIITRNIQTKDEFTELKKSLADPNLKNQILQNQEQLYTHLKEYLIKNKRGGKK